VLVGSFIVIRSPIFLPSRAAPIGEVWEIIPFSGLLSVEPKIVNWVSIFSLATVTVLPMCTMLLFGAEIMVACLSWYSSFVIAERLPRSFLFAAWYEAFSEKSPFSASLLTSLARNGFLFFS